jgi:hypothetical protein
MSVLDVWDLGDDAEALYRSLLRNPDRDAAWYATHLERSCDEVLQGLDALVDVGLARRDGELFNAGSPTSTVDAPSWTPSGPASRASPPTTSSVARAPGPMPPSSC